MNYSTNESENLVLHDMKIRAALVAHVYKHSLVALFSSLFCAFILFIVLYANPIVRDRVIYWFVFFLLITILRVWSVYLYKKKIFNIDDESYRNLYIIGSFFGGLCWGLSAIFLMPQITPAEQVLLILMMAGVTAGVVPLSAAIPFAAIIFLCCTLIPLIIAIYQTSHYVYRIFDFTLVLYLFYTIALSFQTYRLIKTAIALQFENEHLVKSLMETKNQLEFYNDKLRESATHDPLTKIANRRLFEYNLPLIMQRATLRHRKFAMLYFDIDNFKPANDQYGHHAGDYILAVITERLMQLIRDKDLIFRMGGDEFAIILENIDDVETAKKVAQRICYLIAEPIHFNNIDIHVSASIGISVYPDDGKDLDTILKNADKNMYVVKQQGGNNYHSTKINILET